MNTIATAHMTLLVRRLALEDDVEAYKELFCHYHPRLLRFSVSLTKNRQQAEEVVSDVFMKVWTNRKSMIQVQNFHLYLYVSTKNCSLNYIKKESRHAIFLPEEMADSIGSLYFNPEQLLITSEMLKRVQDAIQQLPLRCQLIFRLIKEDGLKYREVAELLDLSIKTVENQMTIALSKIASSIEFDPRKFLLS
jgi:RNA polymerase sigma-70 factor (family 1)